MVVFPNRLWGMASGMTENKQSYNAHLAGLRGIIRKIP